MLYLAKELPAPGQGVQKEMCAFSIAFCFQICIDLQLLLVCFFY